MKNVLILGAGSDIAKPLARLFAGDGYSLTLAARRPEEPEAFTAELRQQYGTDVQATRFDAEDFSSHESFYARLSAKPDVAVCLFGYLGSQQEAQRDWTETKKIIDSNYMGAVSVLNIVANDMEHRRSGCIIGVSSIAGERGRKATYLYASAKAGFTVYLSGLRNRLWPAGVHVMTVIPGYVRTKMIAGKKTPGLLTASPEKAAGDIYRAFLRKKNIIYTKCIWRWVMWIVRNIPEPVFKRLNLP